MSDSEKLTGASSPEKVPSENVSVELQKLRVSRIRRVSDPGAAKPDPETPRPPADEDLLSSTLWRLHVAPAAGRAACPCGRRCRSPGALSGCRRRLLVLRPARLKPARRPLLREPRLQRPAAAAGRTFGAAAPERCSEFAELVPGQEEPGAAAAAAAAPSTAAFAGSGAPVFGSTPAAATAPESGGGPPSTACSLQHRQRRAVSADELAGLVAQVSIMSTMAEMMYT